MLRELAQKSKAICTGKSVGQSITRVTKSCTMVQSQFYNQTLSINFKDEHMTECFRMTVKIFEAPPSSHHLRINSKKPLWRIFSRCQSVSKSMFLPGLGQEVAPFLRTMEYLADIWTEYPSTVWVLQKEFRYKDFDRIECSWLFSACSTYSILVHIKNKIYKRLFYGSFGSQGTY